MKTFSLTVTALLAAGAAFARDQIQVAGSSTVLPYASIVAEVFGENSDFPTPVIESGGSSAGLKQFCEGVGENTIDIANSSRKIRDTDIEVCTANGVNEIIEVRIGYDGIVFASDINGNAFAFEPADVYNALAAQKPVDGAMADNKVMNWNEVNADLPDQVIAAYIPGTKHGTREVFEEKVLLQGFLFLLLSSYHSSSVSFPLFVSLLPSHFLSFLHTVLPLVTAKGHHKRSSPLVYIPFQLTLPPMYNLLFIDPARRKQMP